MSPTSVGARATALILACGALLAVTPPDAAHAAAPTTNHLSWTGYAGGEHTAVNGGEWTVPTGVTSVTVDLVGGKGADNSIALGGLGAHVTGTLSVTPGEVLRVTVGSDGGYRFGGANGGGWGGGGAASGGGGAGYAGGGATDIRIGGAGLEHRVLVAGGGGGTGVSPGIDGGHAGLVGPGESGQAGGNALADNGPSCADSTGAGGGTQTAGGPRAIGCVVKQYYPDGRFGEFGVGADGVSVGTGGVPGASGGGGGWYGGGSSSVYGGGGGGSSYGDPARFTLGAQDVTTTGPRASITYAAVPTTLVVDAVDTLPADGSTTVVDISLLDQSGRLWAGHDVTISGDDAGVVFGTVVPQGNGHYRVGMRSSTTVGTVTLTAATGGITGTTTVEQVKALQQLSFTTSGNSAFAGQTRAVSVSGGTSGNPVQLTSSADCSLSGQTSGNATVRFDHAGSCVITANQAGNANHEDAEPASQTITVAKGAQTLAFTSTAPEEGAVGGTYAVTATGGTSSSPVTFTAGSPTCSVVGKGSGSAIVTFHHVGSCELTANQAGDDDYEAGAAASEAITVVRAKQAIRFTSAPPTKSVVGGEYVVRASTGRLPVELSAVTPAQCSVQDRGDGSAKVAFRGTGSCVIGAAQPGDADHEPAMPVTQVVNVTKPSAQKLRITSKPGKAKVGSTYRIRTKGAAKGHKVTYATTPRSVCTVNGKGVVKFRKAGRCTITAKVAGSGTYLPGQAKQKVTIKRRK
ncbi:glycine-rich protein [Nocardioides sp. W7]|uniref:glycine-rich protein n=1 Tax=Nocardioides sp. W7 TaxID=2931390 RepID=UPI001FD1E1A3|nr:glycine-rich protein [Nocardioides sp. W7]